VARRARAIVLAWHGSAELDEPNRKFASRLGETNRRLTSRKWSSIKWLAHAGPAHAPEPEGKARDSDPWAWNVGFS